MAELRVFRWEGRDAQGRTVQGKRSAPGKASLRWMLAQESIDLTWAGKPRARPLRARERTLLFRQWATLLASGVPLLQAVLITRSHLDDPGAHEVLEGVARRLEGGESLLQSLAAHPDSFDPLALQMVAAGELSGRLEAMLERLADHGERMLALRDRIFTALFYPGLVLILAVALTLALLGFVIPTFAGLYRDAGVALPVPTRIVLLVSDAVLNYGVLMVLGLIAAGVYLHHVWRNDGKGRAHMDHILVGLPVLGPVLAKVALARWAGTFSALFAAGVTFDHILCAAAGATRNRLFADTLPILRSEVAAGQPLSIALASAGVFPRTLIEMVAVGEESGALDSMLARVASYYERETAESLSRLSRLVEPVLMLVLGLIVGGIVIAMYLPVFRLGSVL